MIDLLYIMYTKKGKKMEHCKNSCPLPIWLSISFIVSKNYSLQATSFNLKNLRAIFGEYWPWNMYLLTSKPMIKIKWFFSTFNHKILYCANNLSKNLSQSDRMDCKIITIEGEGKVFTWKHKLLSTFWNLIEIRRISYIMPKYENKKVV
jgi:hypothetical protein